MGEEVSCELIFSHCNGKKKLYYWNAGSKRVPVCILSRVTVLQLQRKHPKFVLIEESMQVVLYTINE